MIKKLSRLTVFLLTFIVALLSFTINDVSASDNNKYLRVITDDTPLYKSVYDTTPLCYLPYTYYVKVLDYKENFVHVKCFDGDNFPAIDGYVPTEMLFDDNLNKDNPYLLLKIRTSGTAILYKDSMLSVSGQYIFSDRELYYYGSLPNGQGKIYLVGYNNTLGYVDESAIYPFIIENHPNDLTFIKDEEIVPEEKPEDKDEAHLFSIRIIIVICLIFAGIIALFVALKKKPKNDAAASYYDENDYE